MKKAYWMAIYKEIKNPENIKSMLRKQQLLFKNIKAKFFQEEERLKR